MFTGSFWLEALLWTAFYLIVILVVVIIALWRARRERDED
jgi:hypothetical protein